MAAVLVIVAVGAALIGWQQMSQGTPGTTTTTGSMKTKMETTSENTATSTVSRTVTTRSATTTLGGTTPAAGSTLHLSFPGSYILVNASDDTDYVALVIQNGGTEHALIKSVTIGTPILMTFSSGMCILEGGTCAFLPYGSNGDVKVHSEIDLGAGATTTIGGWYEGGASFVPGKFYAAHVTGTDSSEQGFRIPADPLIAGTTPAYMVFDGSSAEIGVNGGSGRLLVAVNNAGLMSERVSRLDIDTDAGSVSITFSGSTCVLASAACTVQGSPGVGVSNSTLLMTGGSTATIRAEYSGGVQLQPGRTYHACAFLSDGQQLFFEIKAETAP